MDNGRTKVTLEFDVSDLPMLVEALKLASTRALMCGQEGTSKRLSHISEAIDQKVPKAARVFPGMAWSQICLALYEGCEWSVNIQHSVGVRYWEDKGYIEVRVGDRTWLSKDSGYHRSDEAYRSVVNMLRDLEPLRPVASRIFGP